MRAAAPQPDSSAPVDRPSTAADYIKQTFCTTRDLWNRTPDDARCIENGVGNVKRPVRRRLSDLNLASIVRVGRSPIHGRGLFAARRIPAGHYIGTFHGPPVERDGRHVLWVYLEDTDAPVGRRGENCLRFLNHARPCNVEFHGFDLYAKRRIEAGEELTIDYGH